jgi:hypothetical protein
MVSLATSCSLAARNPYRTAMMHVILGRTDELFDQFADSLTVMRESMSPEWVSFFRHQWLLFSRADVAPCPLRSLDSTLPSSDSLPISSFTSVSSDKLLPLTPPTPSSRPTSTCSRRKGRASLLPSTLPVWVRGMERRVTRGS